MVTRSHSLKKFIKTVIHQLPQYIEQYSKEEQIILGEFLTLLQKCESLAEIRRSALSKALKDYNRDIRQREEYLKLSFLWFIADYFDSANMLLNVSDYHAEDYYAYLVKFLRKNPDLEGIFQLIRDQTPLDDNKWELLQYVCIKPQILTKEELERIKAVHDLIKQEGLLALNPTRIRSVISNQTSKRTPSRLNRFFDPLRSNWHLWFYPPAFGIEEFVFNVETASNQSFETVLDFNSPTNTTLGMSEINRSRKSQVNYLGTLFIPNHLEEYLIDYFNKLETDGLILINELSKVIDIKISSSLSLYEPNKGWRDIKKNEWNQIITSTLESEALEINTESINYFLSSKFNRNWDFRKHTNANRAIDLYCNFPRLFSFDDLPFKTGKLFKDQKFTKREKAHMNELYNNNVVQIIFQSHRLNESFSLDYYWVELKLEKNKTNFLLQLLAYFPLCNIFLTETKIFLLLRLTGNLVERLTSELNWIITPVIPHNIPLSRSIDWFDSKSLKWKTPKFLR